MVHEEYKDIKTGIDVSKIRKQLEKYPEDWGSQQKLKECKIKRSS